MLSFAPLSLRSSSLSNFAHLLNGVTGGESLVLDKKINFLRLINVYKENPENRLFRTRGVRTSGKREESRAYLSVLPEKFQEKKEVRTVIRELIVVLNTVFPNLDILTELHRTLRTLSRKQRGTNAAIMPLNNRKKTPMYARPKNRRS